MPTLTRKVNETIVVYNSEKITIKILSTHNNQVKLGIEAPKNITIYRAEIYRRLKKKTTLFS